MGPPMSENHLKKSQSRVASSLLPRLRGRSVTEELSSVERRIVECGNENKIKKTRKRKRTRTPLPLSQEVMKMLQFSLMNAYILVIR